MRDAEHYKVGQQCQVNGIADEGDHFEPMYIFNAPTTVRDNDKYRCWNPPWQPYKL
jgi:hypothetical protein